MGDWIAQNWFNVFSAVCIVASLLFTADSIRSETKTRRIANLLTITQNHREIWTLLAEQPELDRVLNSSVDLMIQPVTQREEIFIIFVLLHLSSVYNAMKDELLVNLEGLRRDAGAFFSLPIPKTVWEKMKGLQNDDFVAFVEQCVNQN